MQPRKPTKDQTSPAFPAGPRERFVAAARRLFLVNGFRKVSMDEIASEAGISKKTLYIHFASKDNVLRVMLNEKFDEAERELDAVTSVQAHPFPGQLQGMLAILQRQVAEINPLFVRDVQKSDPTLFAMIDRRRQGLIRKHFGRLLETGQASGIVRKDIPSAILIEMLVTTAISLVTPEKLIQFGLSPQDAFTRILDVFLNGILVKKVR